MTYATTKGLNGTEHNPTTLVVRVVEYYEI